MAALNNAAKIVKKKIEDLKIVINGGGAAGISICKLLLLNGSKDVIVCDSKGAIFEGRTFNMNSTKEYISTITNLEKKEGGLADIIQGADLFIGVSAGNVLSKDMVRSMAVDPIIMALANPVPEISPEDAFEAGAKIMCTGRSDYPNQVNNSLAFPGIFNAIMRYRIVKITDEMKLAASKGISIMIPNSKLSPD